MSTMLTIGFLRHPPKKHQQKTAQPLMPGCAVMLNRVGLFLEELLLSIALLRFSRQAKKIIYCQSLPLFIRHWRENSSLIQLTNLTEEPKKLEPMDNLYYFSYSREIEKMSIIFRCRGPDEFEPGTPTLTK